MWGIPPNSRIALRSLLEVIVCDVHSGTLQPQKSLAKEKVLILWSAGYKVSMSLVFENLANTVALELPLTENLPDWLPGNVPWAMSTCGRGDSSWNSVLLGLLCVLLDYKGLKDPFKVFYWYQPALWFMWFEYHIFRWHLKVFPVLWLQKRPNE